MPIEVIYFKYRFIKIKIVKINILQNILTFLITNVFRNKIVLKLKILIIGTRKLTVLNYRNHSKIKMMENHGFILKFMKMTSAGKSNPKKKDWIL